MTETEPRPSLEVIQLAPEYLDVRGEIVKPDQVQIATRYFWARWVPRLGPVASCLLIRLRQYCYFNRGTGERRDWCFPSQDQLAEEIGVQSRKTVMEAIRRLEDAGFVRREKQYRFDRESRRSVRTTDRYRVLMEDPIAPEDGPRALLLASDRARQTRLELGESVPVPSMSEKRTYGSRVPEVAPCQRARRSEIDPNNAVRKMRSKAFDSEEILETNVNVPRAVDQELREADLTAEMIRELHDPGSREFYRLVASRMPPDAIFAVLSETREAKRSGQIRKTLGAYFTHAIKRSAARLGVNLLEKSRC